MNDEKVTIMSFYENWVELMEMCSPEEWYELCTIMTNLRFKGIDTKPKEIENMKIKVAWNLIRPSILKSNRDKRYNDNKKAKETSNTLQDATGTEFDIPQTTNTNPENSMVEQKVEETFYEYCEEVGKFIESDEINIINNILKRAIDYIHFGKTEYEVFAKEGNKKIIEVANKYINLGDEKVWNDFNYYIKLYNTDYLNSMNDFNDELSISSKMLEKYIEEKV